MPGLPADQTEDVDFPLGVGSSLGSGEGGLPPPHAGRCTWWPAAAPIRVGVEQSQGCTSKRGREVCWLLPDSGLRRMLLGLCEINRGRTTGGSRFAGQKLLS